MLGNARGILVLATCFCLAGDARGEEQSLSDRPPMIPPRQEPPPRPGVKVGAEAASEISSDASRRTRNASRTRSDSSGVSTESKGRESKGAVTLDSFRDTPKRRFAERAKPTSS